MDVNTTPNTISRWETATCKLSIEDFEKLARYFGTSISVFFPNIEPAAPVQALLSATGDLDDDDLDELTRYAQFHAFDRIQFQKLEEQIWPADL